MKNVTPQGSTSIESLELPDVAARLAEIYAGAQRELAAILAERPVMREVAELEAQIVAANRELVSLERAELADDAEAARYLGRGVILRRRIEALVAQRLTMSDALVDENARLRSTMAAVTARAQQLVDADAKAVQALADRLLAWRAPRVSVAESRPWERPPLSPAQEKRELEQRLGVAVAGVT